MEAIAFCLQASDPAELGSVARGAVALRACRLDAWLRGPDNPQGHSMRCLLQNLEVLLLVYPLTVSFHFPAMQGRDLPDQLVERHTAAAAFGKGAVGNMQPECQLAFVKRLAAEAWAAHVARRASDNVVHTLHAATMHTVSTDSCC